MDELCYKVLKSIKTKGNVVNISSDGNRKYCSVIKSLKVLFDLKYIVFDEDARIVLTEEGLDYLAKNKDKQRGTISEREEQKIPPVDGSYMYLPKK